MPLGYDVKDRKLVPNEDEAPRVRRVFELFVETQSGTGTARQLQAEGTTSRSGRLLDKGDVYKLLNLRTYVGEVTHKGQVFPGEHPGIVSRELWDQAHAILQTSPRVRTQPRQHAPALLKGLIFGTDGRALSPTHAVRRGRLYRYYVAQRVLRQFCAAGMKAGSPFRNCSSPFRATGGVSRIICWLLKTTRLSPHCADAVEKVGLALAVGS
ncbi:recombinase family protein [Roseococcus sp.]|uniref:recombinase family protein n=1 Tax=Roseococcus sp. TaxID=2109646 RepID=UPI003BA9C5FB